MHITGTKIAGGWNNQKRYGSLIYELHIRQSNSLQSAVESRVQLFDHEHDFCGTSRKTLSAPVSVSGGRSGRP